MLIGGGLGVLVGVAAAKLTARERHEMRQRSKSCYGGRPGATCDWSGERHRVRTRIDDSRQHYHPRYERNLNCNKTVTEIHDRYTGELVERRIKTVCEVENDWLEMEDEDLHDGPPPPQIPGGANSRGPRGPRPMPQAYLGDYVRGLNQRGHDLHKQELIAGNMVPYMEKHNLAINAGQLRDILVEFKTDHYRNVALRELSKVTMYSKSEIKYITDSFRSDRGADLAEGVLRRQIKFDR
jgi:hypothetical protein